MANDQNKSARKSNNKKKSNKAQRRRNRRIRNFIENPANQYVLDDRITANRSVRAGIASVPEASSSYLRSVLDPAHLAEYGARGIPDDNKDPTRMLRALRTFGVPAGFLPVGTNTLTEDTIANLDIWLTDMPGCPIVILGKGSSGLWYYWYSDLPSIEDEIGAAEYRLLARGATIENIGPKAQRGGFFTCSRVTDITYYVDDHNSTAWCFDCDNADANSRVNLSGDHGVYVTLMPKLQENMEKFRAYDTMEVPYIHADGAYTSMAAITGAGSLASLPGWHWSRVRFTPVTPITMSRSSTSIKDFALGALDWNLRISTFTAIEMRSTEQAATNAVGRDPAALNLLFALLEHHSGFYPASYNDMRKVMGAIKRTYKKYKPIIDVAAGYIPYGSNINAALNALLGE